MSDPRLNPSQQEAWPKGGFVVPMMRVADIRKLHDSGIYVDWVKAAAGSRLERDLQREIKDGPVAH